MDGEKAVVTHIQRPGQDLFAQRAQIVGEARGELDGFRLAALAPRCFQIGQAQVFGLGDAPEEIPRPLHASFCGGTATVPSGCWFPGNATTASTSAPYFPALASPRPSISFKPARLSGRFAAIPANCSFVSTA